MTAPRVYLAGPDVFLPDAPALAAAKRALCARHGFVGVSPVDSEIDLSALSRPAAASRISAANEAMIRSCDLLVANLTPFRGPSADVGTVYELGFARALGRPVFGYTNAAGSLLDRTRHHPGAVPSPLHPDRFEDALHMVVEDFDGADNLMIVGAIEASGGRIVVSPTRPELRFTDLAGFVTCLEQAARQLGLRGA